MSRETRLELLYTSGAFLLWGVVPVYWKMLQHVPALDAGESPAVPLLED